MKKQVKIHQKLKFHDNRNLKLNSINKAVERLKQEENENIMRSKLTYHDSRKTEMFCNQLHLFKFID